MASPWDNILMPQFGANQLAQNSPLMNPTMQGPIQDLPLKSQSYSIKSFGEPNKYQNEFEDMFKSSIDSRNVNLADLKSRLEQESQNAPTGFQTANLKPLMAFADSLTGGNSAQSYSAPTAAKDHASKLERMQKAFADQSGALSDDQLNYLKSKAQEEMYKSREASSDKKMQKALDRQTQSGEFRLREKWESNSVTKASQSMDDHYRRITGVEDTTAAGQMSMIFAYMKMLDDGSVVRESEFANAARAAGMPDRANQYIDKLKTGRILSPQQIAEFKNSAESIMNEVREKQGRLDSDYKTLAQEYGYNPERVAYGVGFKGKSKSAPGAAMDFDNMSAEDLAKYMGQ